MDDREKMLRDDQESLRDSVLERRDTHRSDAEWETANGLQGTTHVVHIYAVVRIPIRGVVADNHREAMEKALKAHLEQNELDHLPGELEDAEEVVGFMVDEEGDEEYTNTKAYDCRREEANHPYIKEEPCETGTEHVNDAEKKPQ